MSLYFKKDYHSINSLLRELMEKNGKKYTIVIHDKHENRCGAINKDKYKFVDSFDELKKEFLDAIFAVMQSCHIEFVNGQFVRNEGRFTHLEEFFEHSHSYELFECKDNYDDFHYIIDIIELNKEEIKNLLDYTRKELTKQRSFFTRIEPQFDEGSQSDEESRSTDFSDS